LEAAEVVIRGEGITEADVLGLISNLVDKSLLTMEVFPGPSRVPRYRMLEPVRQFAQEQLEESGETQSVRREHARWCVGLAEEAEAGSNGSSPAESLDHIEADYGNLRAALRWTLACGDTGVGLRLGGALWWFWYARGHLTEGRMWLEGHLSGNGFAPTRIKGRALNCAGWIAIFQGDFEGAKALVEDALVLFRGLGDEEGVATSLTLLGCVAVLGERDDMAVADLLQEAVELRPKLKDRRALGTSLELSGIVAALEGEYRRSDELHSKAVALFREAGDDIGVNNCLNTWGLAALSSRDYEKASALLKESLRLSRKSEHRVTTQSALVGLGAVAVSRRQPARAARLWGAAEYIGETFGIRMTPAGLSLIDFEGHLKIARSHLDGQEFTASWSEGKALSLAATIEYALADKRSKSSPPPPHGGIRPETPVLPHLPDVRRR
jgi:tetratricopeptide (TPR) repeat protein